VFCKIKQCVGRTLALGVILAVAGFCYATSSGSAPRSTDSLPDVAVPRLVGSTTLRFTNAQLPSGVFDLGDAEYGSAVNRYITLAGGVRPYTTVSTDLLSVLLQGANVTNASLTLGGSGELLGTIAQTLFLLRSSSTLPETTAPVR